MLNCRLPHARSYGILGGGRIEGWVEYHPPIKILNPEKCGRCPRCSAASLQPHAQRSFVSTQVIFTFLSFSGTPCWAV